MSDRVARALPGCQVAPPSEVAKLRPSAVVTVASLALPAATATRLFAVGAERIAQCSPSVVRTIVPALAHDPAYGRRRRRAAIRSVFTPLCWICVPLSASLAPDHSVLAGDPRNRPVGRRDHREHFCPRRRFATRSYRAAGNCRAAEPLRGNVRQPHRRRTHRWRAGSRRASAILWVTSPLIACARGAASGLASFIAIRSTLAGGWRSWRWRPCGEIHERSFMLRHRDERAALQRFVWRTHHHNGDDDGGGGECGIATRHLRNHAIPDTGLASIARSPARAIAANCIWHRAQSAK